VYCPVALSGVVGLREEFGDNYQWAPAYCLDFGEVTEVDHTLGSGRSHQWNFQRHRYLVSHSKLLELLALECGRTL